MKGRQFIKTILSTVGGYVQVIRNWKLQNDDLEFAMMERSLVKVRKDGSQLEQSTGWLENTTENKHNIHL